MHTQDAEKALEAQLPAGLTDSTTKTASEAYSSASPFLARFVQVDMSCDYAVGDGIPAHICMLTCINENKHI